MTAIINRTPTGRIISLHAEIKYLKARYGLKSFPLKGLKYDSSEKINPLMFFPLVKKHPSIGVYDPYLDNPLDPSKFHLTRSIQYDTLKSKSASECLNALEALGWVDREGRLSKLTKEGLRISEIPYESEEFFNPARDAVLGYGVFIGFLFKCFKTLNDQSNTINKDEIEIGYKDTHEFIEINGRKISLSTGSQKDTIVRTRSTLFAWAITTGFALPASHPVPKKLTLWHMDTLNEISNKHWGWNKMQMFIPEKLFDGSHYVDRPLSYKWMTKSTRALRERGQEEVRKTSLGQEDKVKNRRFAIVYVLALAAKNAKKIDFKKLIIELASYPSLFVINANDFELVMQIEKDIAIISGIPFSELEEILTPLTKINIRILTEGAPENIIKRVEEIFPKITN